MTKMLRIIVASTMLNVSVSGLISSVPLASAQTQQPTQRQAIEALIALCAKRAGVDPNGNAVLTPSQAQAIAACVEMNKGLLANYK